MTRGVLFALVGLLTACGQMPSPLAPTRSGSIGMPQRGVLEDGAELPSRGIGYAWLRASDHHFGLPRFTAAVARAAAKVAKERPGGLLTIGDLSVRHGGRLLPHLSHRNGRDADLLLFLSTLDGAPLGASPDFLAVGADGLAFDERTKRFYRFDVEREWLLVKALLEDEDAQVQWVFVHHALRAMLLEWARARGEPEETILRAAAVMLQPAPPAQPHDDHIHVRTACTADDVAAGCLPSGPDRPWLTAGVEPPDLPSNDDLARELLAPLEGPGAVAIAPALVGAPRAARVQSLPRAGKAALEAAPGPED